MFQDILLTNRHFQDLNPLVAGQEDCASGHSFGPAVRKYVLIHYVVSGKGMYYAPEGAYPVTAGQAFVILPGEVTTYIADLADPWHYIWIGFNGQLTQAFHGLGRVFDAPGDIFTQLITDANSTQLPEFTLSAGLFQLYARLFGSKQTGNDHVKRVKNYIRTCYMQPVRVEQIAQQLNLDRRYLSRLFKAHTGQTMQEYLLNVRLEAARQHLNEGCSVAQAAALCGYEDVSNFSRMFKRRFGVSPGHYC